MDINGIKIDAVPIVGLLSYFQKHVIAQYRLDIESVSKDEKFVWSALKEAPKGSDLLKAVDDYRLSIDGFIDTIKYSIAYHNKDVPTAKVQEILDKLDVEHLKEMVAIIYGIKDVEAKKKLTLET
jgi:hypothetical protein